MVTLLPGLEGSQSSLCSLSFNLSAGLHVPGMQFLRFNFFKTGYCLIFFGWAKSTHLVIAIRHLGV